MDVNKIIDDELSKLEPGAQLCRAGVINIVRTAIDQDRHEWKYGKRCYVTGNHVGTDTRPTGSPCKCQACSPPPDDLSAKMEQIQEHWPYFNFYRLDDKWWIESVNENATAVNSVSANTPIEAADAALKAIKKGGE